MKKFVLNILLLTGLMIILLGLYNTWVSKMDTSYVSEIKKIPRAKIISIGNSEGLRLKMGALKQDSIADLCLSGADLFSSVEVFDAVADHLTLSQIVFLNVNNTSFYQNSKMVSDSSMVYDLNIQTEGFYNNLPLAYLKRGIFFKYLKSKMLGVNGILSIESSFSYILKKMLPARLYKLIKSNKEKSEEQLLHAPSPERFDWKGKSQKAVILSASAICPGIHKKALEALQQIKSIADAHHLTLIAYSCPRHERYLQIFGKEMFDSTDSDVKLELKRVNIPYFNHLYDEEFISDYNGFYDCAHLNKFGAQKFDNKLFKEVSAAFPQYSEFFNSMIR